MEKAICDCGRQWVWSWNESDTTSALRYYIRDGETDVKPTIIEAGEGISLYKCICGVVNAVDANDIHTENVLWRDVDWEEEENSL